MKLSMDEVRKQYDGIKKLYEQGVRSTTASVEQVLDLFDTIEALQQENKQLRAQLDEWKYEVQCHMDEVIAMEKQMARMWHEKPAKQQEYCPNCGYKTVTDGKYVCCFACGYNV